MLDRSVEDTQEVNQVRIDEIKVRDDVKMYRQLPCYYDFRGFDLPNGNDLTAIRKESTRGLRNHHG